MMTTTLRPTEPLQRAADGALSRHFQVCVNSRPVGALHLTTDPVFGPSVAVIDSLHIDAPDRRRGRGTVGALAAEEVARGWGCARIEIAVPVDGPALRLVTALGYLVRNTRMAKDLGPDASALPPGTTGRPMTGTEFDTWYATALRTYARTWTERGVPADQADAKSRRDHEGLLPHGNASENMLLSVLEHRGTPVGTLWLALQDEQAYIYDVETAAAYRGHGHGRSLMLLAETQTLASARRRIGLNVFAGNTPAERLYDSLGYVPIERSLFKPLL
ncbi:GNAT family N-acetyltransferase [Streptomyces sp. NPDC093252]|uniref:GNAT family N-acetyltransferase n=1 Tax=Streptomyces sp. NPDC093252 TaxID=3154980 RepID=UPI003413891D